MGSINQTHVFFIIVALVAMYGIAEFYYYSPLVVSNLASSPRGPPYTNIAPC